MRVRGLLLGVLAVTGCESFRLAGRPEPETVPTVAPAHPPGASAPGLPDPVAPEPDDPLTLAAEAIGRGDESSACVHLDAHVRQHPDQLMFRLQLAELLVRTGKPELARFHLERFAAAAADAPAPVRGQLIACHTRLMELAADASDEFAEHFHRGVGLLLVVELRADETDEGFREQLLCKAAKSLSVAKELRPTDARTHLYLADVFDRMGNKPGAAAEWRAARNAAQPGSLSPAEQKRLVAVGK